MKKTPVDYNGFSIKRINEPRFAHAKLLLDWPAYLASYLITENLIPAGSCHVIHGFLDDIIPFNEYFVVFYLGWFLFVAVALVYTFFYDVERFKKLQLFLIITQVLAISCYIIYPSIQDLRPEVFPRQNLFTRILGFIYAIDTPTGICPSLHAAYSIGILSAALKDKDFSGWIKATLCVLVLMICLSVCFVKQHSSIDVLAALPVCLIAEIVVYGKDYWKPKWIAKRNTDC